MSTFTEASETQTTPRQPEPPETPRNDNRRWDGLVVVAVAAFAVVLVGLVAWAVVRDSPTPELEVDGDVDIGVDQLVDDYIDAWNRSDADGFLALVTDDFVIRFTDDSVVSAQDQAISLEQSANNFWRFEAAGESVVSGDGPWYVVRANHFDAAALGSGGVDCISVFTVTDAGGELQVAQHDLFGEF